jgi:hypothetical protein
VWGGGRALPAHTPKSGISSFLKSGIITNQVILISI